MKSDPSRAHLGASPLPSAHVTAGVTPIRHVLKELKNEKWVKNDVKILWDSAERQCSLARREQRQHFGARGARLKLVQEREVWLERLAARGWPLEPLEPERGANAAAVGTFRGRWWSGLGHWAGRVGWSTYCDQ